MHYSASQKGFFHPLIHPNMPQDAIEISDADYAALLIGKDGHIIAPDASGKPVLTPLPPPPMDHVRAQAVAAMEAWISHFLAKFTAGVPEAEVASWPVKAERARQHLGGAPQAMIAAEAALTGEDAKALAQKIAAKAAAYEAIIARTTGLRRATEAAIAAAQTPEAVAAILQGARAKAEAMAASLGVGPAAS